MKAEDYLQRAYRSIYENDFAQAMHWFERALDVQPDHADIHYRYSITCARSGQLEATGAKRKAAAEPAARMLKRAVELDPLSLVAQVWLAIAYGELECYDLALQAVRNASALPLDAGAEGQLKELEQRLKQQMKQSS